MLPDVAIDGLTRRRALRATGLAGLAGLLALVVLASLAIGTKPIPLGTVIDAFVHFDGSNDHLVVRELRLPRTLVGVLVGAALGVAGALMQAITRNPLADPGLLGVNAGAALAVVIGIAVFGIGSLTAYVWLAFAGAAVDLGRGVRAGVDGTWRRHTGPARARRRGAVGAARCPDVGARPARPADARPVPVLGGRLARRTRSRRAGRRCCRSSRSGSSSASVAPGR